MGDLPWLVVHGTAVWHAAVGVAALAGFSWGGLRATRAGRREAVEALAALGPVTPRGEWRGGATVTAEGIFEAREDFDQIPRELTPSGPGRLTLALRVGPHRIPIEGNVQIAVGSRETRNGRGSASRGEERPWSPALRELSPGDRVLARGVLRALPGTDQGAAYRATARAAWRLEAPAGGQIVLASVTVPSVAGPALMRRGAAAMGWALVAFVALCILSDLLLSASLVPTPVGELATTIAAALPGHRTEALRRLEARTEMELPGLEVPRRLVALALLRNDCDSAIEAAMDHGQLGLAASTASNCLRFRAAALAWYGLGHFEQASAAYAREPSQWPNSGELIFEVDVHLLARRYARAATVVDRLAEIESARQSMPGFLDDGVASRVRALGLRCVASAVRAREGSMPARDALESAAGQGNRACAILWADLQPPHSPSRLRALHVDALDAPSGEPLQPLVAMMLAETDRCDFPPPVETTLPVSDGRPAPGTVQSTDDLAGWAAADQHDGAPLVAAAIAHDGSDERSAWIYVGARGISRGRDVLDRWLRWGDVSRTWKRPPEERLVAVTRRVMAAEAVGDGELASDLRAVQARYTAALDNREIAVVRAVLSGI